MDVYMEFYRLWSSPAFKVKSEQKILNREKRPEAKIACP
jgi:hypothetical protein